MSPSVSSPQPVLAAPFRWALRAVAWLAFGICAFLAWKAVSGSAVSACLANSGDCDAVQGSSWAWWLGVPVAVIGLACYASLASLSVMTGLSGPTAVRWISTLLAGFSLTAALGGLWFTGIQLFALGTFCLWCLALHVCGWAIAALVVWGLITRPRSVPGMSAAPVGVGAVRAAAPATPGIFVPRTIRPVSPARANSGPSWAIAGAGAATVLVALAGGQLLFPADTSHREMVALDEPIELGTKSAAEPIGPPARMEDAQAYTANRIPVEIPTPDQGVVPAAAQTDDTSVSEPTSKQDTSEAATGDEGTAGAAAKSAPPDVAPRPKRVVTLLDGSVTLDMNQHAVLGNPEAKHVVLEFVSYDCSHCRNMHRMVHRALARYGDQVAVVIMTIPAESDCNKEVAAKNSIIGACATARMAIGVAKLEPAKFEDFHNWLMSGKDRPPSPAQAVQRAYSVVGRDRMKEMPRDDLQKQITQYVDLFIKIKSKTADPKKVGLPLMVVGNQILSGSQESEEKVFSAWEESLGIQPSRRGESPAF